MQVKDDAKPYDDINITPMLDLAYVLLVIFIIMTTAAVQGVKVQLPKTGPGQNLAKPRTVALTINTQGQVFMDTYPVSLGELQTRLQQRKAANPDLPVIIKGDGTVAYKQITQVMELLGRIDITEVGFASQREQG